MILLTWAMLRARRVQALTVFLLAALAVAAAVAAPLYVSAARRAVMLDDIAAAPHGQRSINAFDQLLLRASPDDRIGQGRVAGGQERAFEAKAPAAMRVDGFDTIFSVEYPAFFGTGPFRPLDVGNGALSYREHFCEHVTMVAGRCVSGPGEVIVERNLAGFAPGATVVSTPVRLIVGTFGEPDFYLGNGEPSTLVVVGVFERQEGSDPYWGPFSTPGKTLVLTDRRTFAGTDHDEEAQAVLTYPRPDTFATGDLDRIRADVQRVVAESGRFQGQSDFDALFTRIDADQTTVGLVPGIAAVPLIALCWYVLFLAIAYTSQARRSELGMVKLRGVARRDQWWLVAAESLGPVVAGAVVGYLVGHVVVWLYAGQAFSSRPGFTIGAAALPYAAVALAGAFMAGLLALGRDLWSSATDLLRRVPARRTGWRGLSLAILVCALAGLAVFQLAGEAGAGGGLARFAPALSIVGLGLLVAVVVDPLLGWLGGRALRRGRVGLALAGLNGGRRRSGSRLFALVAIAVALLAYAATAAEVADDTRRRQATVTVGADQVLTVEARSPAALLAAVRSVDPDGRYAMAVQPIYTGPALFTGPTGSNGRARPVYAVDAPRLPVAARWPDGLGLDAGQAATALHPDVGPSVVVRGTGVAVDATVATNTPDAYRVDVIVTVARLDSGEQTQHVITPPLPGRPYRTEVACAQGCRLVDVRIRPSIPEGRFASTTSASVDVSVVIAAIRQTGPDAVLASSADLARWNNRSLGAMPTEPGPAGLRARVLSLQNPLGLPLMPPDTPAELAILDAGDTNVLTLPLADDQRVVSSVVSRVDTLPRIGTYGAFTDLEYLLRVGRPIKAGPSQVWLGPRAPADVVDRLTAAGLQLRATARIVDEIARSAAGASSIGLRFLVIVALLGLMLGAAGVVVAAGVERRARAEELRALRIQGIRRASALRAALSGYLGVAVVAAGAGLLIAAAVWAATGSHLPIVDGSSVLPSVPVRPGPRALAWWAGGAAMLATVAGLVAWALAQASQPVVRRERTSP